LTNPAEHAETRESDVVEQVYVAEGAAFATTVQFASQPSIASPFVSNFCWLHSTAVQSLASLFEQAAQTPSAIVAQPTSHPSFAFKLTSNLFSLQTTAEQITEIPSAST